MNIEKLRREALAMRYREMSLPAKDVLWLCDEIAKIRTIADQQERDAWRWRAVADEGPPEPEVFVLCWDGKRTFIDWFGSKQDAGRGVTHWMPYPMPPGAKSAMHNGARAIDAARAQEPKT